MTTGIQSAALALLAAASPAFSAPAFEGRIEVVLMLGTESTALTYTAGTAQLRIEVTGSTAANPADILDLKSGVMTLLFPHNRSFVRVKPAGGEAAMPGLPTMPLPPGGLPPGIGLQARVPSAPGMPNMPAIPRPPAAGGMPAMPMPPGGLPPGIGPQARMPSAPGMPNMPAIPRPPAAGGMPMMPMMGENLELKATGEKATLLGYECEKFEMKQRGETMEVWATRKLFPYEPYLRSQQPRFGPRVLEEQWPALVKEKKLFPLRAILRYENGTEHFRFEVKAVKAEKLKPEEAQLFEPPANYVEIAALPF